MKIKVSKNIGKSLIQFEIEEPKDVEALAKAGMVASIPENCQQCKSNDVHLVGKKAKGYTFVEVKCNSCGSASQMGQYKEGGIFWKKWERYQPEIKVEDDDTIPVIEEE